MFFKNEKSFDGFFDYKNNVKDFRCWLGEDNYGCFKTEVFWVFFFNKDGDR